MFIFFLIFLVVNLLTSIGYLEILQVNTDFRLKIYSLGTSIGFFILFLMVPSIMEYLIFWFFIYQILGLSLFFRGVWIYSRNEKREKEKEYEDYN
jgi:uncharacterized protein HemY